MGEDRSLGDAHAYGGWSLDTNDHLRAGPLTLRMASAAQSFFVLIDCLIHEALLLWFTLMECSCHMPRQKGPL